MKRHPAVAASPTLAKSNEYLLGVLRLVGLATGTGRVESVQLVLSAPAGTTPKRSSQRWRRCTVLLTDAADLSTPRIARPLLDVLERPGGEAGSPVEVRCGLSMTAVHRCSA